MRLIVSLFPVYGIGVFTQAFYNVGQARIYTRNVDCLRQRVHSSKAGYH